MARRIAYFLLFLILSLAVSTRAPAQGGGSLPSEKQLTALLEHMQENQKANWKLKQQYTSVMLWHNRNFNKDGKTTVDVSAKYENVFVEGLPYTRKVEKDGKPLSGKDAEEEEERYNKAIEERKKMSLEEKRHGFQKTFNFALPLAYLASCFDNRALRVETIDGRETLVVESTPRDGAQPAEKNAKTALDWKQTTWIDLKDAMPARFLAEKLNDNNHEMKGTTIEFVYLRLLDKGSSGEESEKPVWLEKSFLSQFHVKIWMFGGKGITEQSWSDYKRFHVNVRLLEGTMQEIEGK